MDKKLRSYYPNQNPFVSEEIVFHKGQLMIESMRRVADHQSLLGAWYAWVVLRTVRRHKRVVGAPVLLNLPTIMQLALRATNIAAQIALGHWRVKWHAQVAQRRALHSQQQREYQQLIHVAECDASILVNAITHNAATECESAKYQVAQTSGGVEPEALYTQTMQGHDTQPQQPYLQPGCEPGAPNGHRKRHLGSQTSHAAHALRQQARDVQTLSEMNISAARRIMLQHAQEKSTT